MTRYIFKTLVVLILSVFINISTQAFDQTCKCVLTPQIHTLVQNGIEQTAAAKISDYQVRVTFNIAETISCKTKCAVAFGEDNKTEDPKVTKEKKEVAKKAYNAGFCGGSAKGILEFFDLADHHEKIGFPVWSYEIPGNYLESDSEVEHLKYCQNSEGFTPFIYERHPYSKSCKLYLELKPGNNKILQSVTFKGSSATDCLSLINSSSSNLQKYNAQMHPGVNTFYLKYEHEKPNYNKIVQTITINKTQLIKKKTKHK